MVVVLGRVLAPDATMTIRLHTLKTPAQPALPQGFALFALGFRPFFLSGSIYTVLMMGLWLLTLRGALTPTALPPIVWHGHEMVYGYTVAVIAGFLLAAVQNWTGIRMPSGRPLVVLFVLWLAGRVVFLVPGLPDGLVAAVDLAFLPALAFALGRPIHRVRQLNNYPFPVMLLALTLGNVLMHAEHLGWASGTALTGLHLGVYIVVMMMALMGGRVIPSFTDNRLRTRARHWPAIERLVPVATLAALLGALVAPVSPVTAVLAACAALVHGIRWGGWVTMKYWSVPLLWILHLGYAWIVLGFVLLALSAAGLTQATGPALHAFTSGGIGVLTLGMMARVSLGHTGRPMEPPRIMTLAFILVNLAALLRVGLPLVAPQTHPVAMALSGSVWILAFGIFVAMYAPMLVRPRVDGRMG